LKKVLLTLNNNVISGIEMFSILLAEKSDKSKYDFTIAIPEKGDICEVLDEKGIKYITFHNGTTGKYSLSGIFNLFKIIFTSKYDIIHAQAGIAPCIIGKLVNNALLIEHKHGLDFTIEEIENMNYIKKKYESIKKYFTDFTMTGCKADKIILVEKFGYNENKVKVIYNGLEDSKLPEINKSKKEKFIIGTIGRLTYQKAQEYLIDAAELLIRENDNFEFHIYGSGELYDKYKNMIIEKRLENKVFLKGYSSDTLKTILEFDIFVLTSRYEGIPYVVIESMKAGIPVISTDVGGINEVIANNENGLLIKKEDPLDLMNKILIIYNSEEMRIRLSQKATEDFKNYYTLDKTISEIDSVYSLVNQN